MQGRNEQQAKTENKGARMPDMSVTRGKFGRVVTTVIIAVVMIVSLCSLPFWAAGFFGYNAISNGTTATSRSDPRRNDPRTVHDPLNCVGKGMWVVSWNSPTEGKKYGCTPKWK